MAGKPLSPLILLDDGTLLRLAGMPRVVAQFPFLKVLAVRGKTSTGCNKCSRDEAVSANFQTVKQAIANLDSSSKRKLKEMLNARQLRVNYKSGSNKTITLTF
jgi:hypothetical protein